MTYRSSDSSSGAGPGGAPSGPAASAPSAGAPAGSGPAKAGPTTGGPTTTGPVIPYVTTPRGPTSRTTLKIDWKHPVQKGAYDPESTSAVPRRRALPADEALTKIAGDDRRPLLVLRECHACSGTEDALLTSAEDNERTYLLARWFHCVKLPPDVLEADHPFTNLFPGDKPAHLFISNSDGSSRHDLLGVHSRRELWGAMERAIESSYQGAYTSLVTRLTRLLDNMDMIDRAITDLETRFELATAGLDDAKKVKKLQEDLAERRQQRAELLAAADRISQLELKQPAQLAAK